MAQYERYGRDGETLAAIGRAIRDGEGTGPVTLPLDLARAAVDAWRRAEPEEPANPESPWQVHVRRQAAALALIGEEIEQRADLGSDPVIVTLGAGLVRVAIAAADDVLVRDGDAGEAEAQAADVTAGPAEGDPTAAGPPPD